MRSDLGRFVGIPPPQRRKSRNAILGQRIGMAEPVPARGALFVVAPLRHDIVVPKQYAVERPGGGNQFIVAVGEDDTIDHRIDCRVFDADHVVRAQLVGRPRTPIVAQPVAG